jgi:hypothetical protein
MTAERPMFPPRAGECRVIQFSQFAAAAKLSKEDDPPQDNALTRFREERVARREAKLLELTTAPETLTTTCKNQRMRLSRRDAWWAAGRLTDYWRARLDWWSALSIAQSNNVADANSYPKCHDDFSNNRLALVDLWRAALMNQMLTPAPDGAAVNWKRAQLRRRAHRYTAVKPEKLERAIEADVQWLNDHPMRAKKDS